MFDRMEYNISVSFKRGLLPQYCKGGGSPDPPSSSLADTENRQYARETLYPIVDRGLRGRGFGSASFVRQQGEDLYKGLDKTYGTAKSELSSQLSRTIDPKDTRVKDFVGNTLSRAYASKKQDITENIRAEKVSDIDFSMNLASSYLAGEKRMSINAAGAYNNALQSNLAANQQMGTFGSNIASGVGSGMMDYYFAKQMTGT